MAPQVIELCGGQLKGEIRWEAFAIPRKGPVKHFSLDAIKFSQVGVEHDPVGANDEN